MRPVERLDDARTAISAWSHGATADPCGPCVEVLEVTGASVSLLTGTVTNATLCATDPVVARIDELQLDLGEGPCWEALDHGAPVLVPDLGRVHGGPWPLFAAASHELPVGGIFAFPLRVGAVDLGSLDLYRTAEGPLDPRVVRDAVSLAGSLSAAVLHRLLADEREDLRDWERQYTDSRRVVHQATGMILAQVGTTASGAFALLRARAFAEGRSVRAVAEDVTGRRLSFVDGASA